eukprot:s40_g22.t1
MPPRAAAVVLQLKSAQWLEALRIYNEAVRQQVELNVILYGAAISACKSQWPVALWLLGRLQDEKLQSDAVLYSNCINSCRKGGQWRHALFLLEDFESKEIQSDLFVYNGALGALGACEAASWSRALQLFSSLRPPRRPKRDAVALSAAITALERCSEWQSILALLFKEASPANLISYNGAISALGRLGQWQIALQLVMVLEARRFKLDAISYNSLISSFSTAHLWREAVRVLERFEEVRLQRDHFSYSATMRACGQAHFWQQACQLLEVPATTVDHVMVNAALEACALAVQWQQALHLSLHSSHVAKGWQRPLVMALGKGAQWQLALLVLREMAPVVSEKQLVAAWNTVIGTLSSVSLSRALELLGIMEESQLRTDSRMYAELIDAAEKNQRWESRLSHCSVVTACHQSQQWQLAGWMLSALPHQQLEPDLATRNMLIDISETGGQWQEAVESYQKAEETWGVDIVGITSAMSALSAARRWRQSAFLFRLASERSLEATGMTYTVAVRAYLSAKKLRRGLQLLADLAARRAENAARIAGNAAVQAYQLDSPWCKALSFYNAVRCLLGEREGNDASDVSLLSSFDRASQWQRSMVLGAVRRGTFPTPSVSVMKVNTVINACSMALEWRRGLSLLSQLPLHGLQGSCVSFHSAFAGLGTWQMVLGLLDRLGGELSLDTCHAALQALRRDEIFALGQKSSFAWQAAVQLFGVAKKAQLQVSIITLNLLISTVPWSWAVHLFGSMQPDSYSYQAVINACLRADQWQRSLEFCRSMRLQALNPGERIHSLLLERCLGGAFPSGDLVLKSLELAAAAFSSPRGASGPRSESRGSSGKRSAPIGTPSQDKTKPGKTSGFFALGAWSARLEIARLLEAGVPASEILEEINSGREGETPLAACNPPDVNLPGEAESFSPPPKSTDHRRGGSVSQTTGKTPEVGSGGATASLTPVVPERPPGGAPSWTISSTTSPFSFGKKAPSRPAPVPPDKAPAPPGDDKSDRAWDEVSEGYSASVGKSESPRQEEKEVAGILGTFTKKAFKPEGDPKKERGPPYIPMSLPKRTRPLEAQKLEQYRKMTRALFEDMVIMGVPMDLIADVSKDGTEIDDAVFTTLTDPKSAGTGLRYARLLRRFLDAFAEGKSAEELKTPFDQPSLQAYVVKLIQDEVGYRTPQSLLYAVEFYSGIFGFACPGAAHQRVRKLSREYIAKAPERDPAPYFSVQFLEYLERVVLDTSRDVQIRVSCGKLRLCTQASIRHSDLAATAMADVEWCRLVGKTEVLGLRARAAYTKSGPRPWAAALLGVVPAHDKWLICLVELLLHMHGPGWREHTFVGCASNGSGGFDPSPPLIGEDVNTVKRALAEDLERGKKVPLDAEAIGHLRWHSCKTTLPTYMTHFGVRTRTVRFQGAWKKQSQLMPDLYLREAQTLVMKGQMEVLDQIRRGAVVQALEGHQLDHIPMKAEWRPASTVFADGDLPAGNAAFRDAMEKAVVCSESPKSGKRSLRASCAPSILELNKMLRGAGADDEQSLAETTATEQRLMEEASRGSPVPEMVDSLNEVDSALDSDDSDVDPDEADMDRFPFFIQLATGSGKIHKPLEGGDDQPACGSRGSRFTCLSLEEDWGTSYKLCSKCFGNLKGDEGCPMLCDFVQIDPKTQEKTRCGRRCDAMAVDDHKMPDAPDFVKECRHRCAVHCDEIADGDL